MVPKQHHRYEQDPEMTIETKIDVKGADGTAEAYLYSADREAKLPAVLFLTDIMGIREANRGMAKRVSRCGLHRIDAQHLLPRHEASGVRFQTQVRRRVHDGSASARCAT